MEVIKKIARLLFITLLIVIFTFPLWIKIVPNRYLSLLTGKVAVIDKVVCNFSTKVGGESMNPLIVPGSMVALNRCFQEEDLTAGTVVLYTEGSTLRFSIIRHILPLDPIVYKISDEKAPDLLHDVIKEEIVGITKSIDISKTKYQAKQEAESFILDADEFLTDFYLGKIPRGYGVEMATVEKTNLFFIDKDKFCTVIVPKKDLISVGTEIVNVKTRAVVRSSKDVVLNVRPEPNIGCEDFGASQGMLNVAPGTYQYRFLMNHQVLADIQFEVR